LGLDQALLRTSEDLMMSHPALSDELSLLILEIRAGRPRSDAWRHLAERTDVPSVRSLVAMLLQAELYGTSVAKALRNFSDLMRVQRRQDAEEMAAKTTVKLVFPLVVFIFPSMFLVLMGPSFIVLFDAFEKYFS
jgi:tight adherence protein C